MAKTLDFAYGTPHEVKVGDDETTFTLVCKNEDLLVDLTTAKSITAKIGNSSGYLREQLINIDSLAKLPTGQFKFNFDKDTLTNFPTGNYFLEVWVTDDQGTSIYPSGSPLNFTVTTNIENSSGASITTIAFDDFVQAMNKAASTIAKGDPGEGLDIKGQVTSVSALPATASEGDGYLVNEELYVYTSGAWKDCGTIQGPQGIQGKTGTGISSTTIQYQISNSATAAPTGTWSNNIVATTTANPYLWMKATLNYTDNTAKDFYLISQKGDKGDTGTVDNAGLTTAPAFQALQTQVNNSAVGTNLLIGTATPVSINGNNSSRQAGKSYSLVEGMTAYALYQKYGRTFTLSYDWSVTDTASAYTGSMQQQFNSTPWGFGDDTTISSSNKSGHKVTTFNLVNNSANTATGLQFRLDNVPTTSTITVSNMKLEKGSVATDWSPNPTEILTQADYAKIKAAIVALGGSL